MRAIMDKRSAAIAMEVRVTAKALISTRRRLADEMFLRWTTGRGLPRRQWSNGRGLPARGWDGSGWRLRRI